MDPRQLPTYTPQGDMFSTNEILQPPRIFGDFASDGPLQTGVLPPDYLQGSMGAPVGEEQHDNGDTKRRRIAKACDACRRKKIKCDGKQPCCSHCENYKTDCVYTHVEKKRAPPKGAKYIEGLENRLGRMENVLKLSGLVSQDEANGTDLGTLEERLLRQGASSTAERSPTSTSLSPSQGLDSSVPSPRRSSAQSPNAQGPSRGRSEEEEQPKEAAKKTEIEDLSDMMCSLHTDLLRIEYQSGSSSGLSIFSPQGIAWVNSKTGDTSFQDMVAAIASNDNQWFDWRPDVFEKLDSSDARDLPPKEELVNLVVEFFGDFNQMFPLFHEQTFWHLFDQQFTGQPVGGSGWWAALNIVLAIGARIVTMKSMCEGGKYEDGDLKAWRFFKNSLSVHTELTLKNTDLLSVQALLGMAIFMQGTPNPQPSFSLLGSAVRLMHATGLHMNSNGFGLNKTEVEQRKRVAFLAFMLDKDTALRSGRPPLLTDWSVSLPDEISNDGVGMVPIAVGKEETVNLFRTLCEFAVIAGDIYEDLYSVKASKQSDGELLETIGRLDSALEAWKEKLPREFQPDEISKVDEKYLIQLVSVHFAYYNAITSIHRQSIHHGFWSSRLSNFAIKGLNMRPLNPRVFSSAAICVQAARASINLLAYLPGGDFACVWLLLYYPVSALCTLFANTLQNPADVHAKADLKLMGVVVSFLAQICMEEDTGSIKRMYQICKEFERITKAVLTKADKEMSVRQRKRQEREQEKLINPVEGPHAGQKRSADAALQASAGEVNGLYPNVTAPVFVPGDTTAFKAEDGFVPDAMTPYSGDGSSDMLSQKMQQPQPTDMLGDGNFDDFNFNFSGGQSNREGSTVPSAVDPGAFQEPFLPPDFWSMPMTFEWDWANVGNQMGEDGRSGGPNVP